MNKHIEPRTALLLFVLATLALYVCEVSVAGWAIAMCMFMIGKGYGWFVGGRDYHRVLLAVMPKLILDEIERHFNDARKSV